MYCDRPLEMQVSNVNASIGDIILVACVLDKFLLLEIKVACMPNISKRLQECCMIT